MDINIAALKDIALFKNLAPEKIKKIAGILRKVTFRADEFIMREGETGDTMYIILEGVVEIAKSLVIGNGDNEDSGKNKVFTRLDGKQCAVFGEMALLEESKRTASVRAVTDCVMYEMKKDDFLNVAEGDHELGYRILLNLGRIVSARLRRADEDTVKLTTALSIMLHEA
jgi:CRP/FNR family transcriptional regulator, cyclic AMP receptor protein